MNRALISIGAGTAALAAVLGGSLVSFDVDFGSNASAAPSVLTMLGDVDGGTTDATRSAHQEEYLQSLADKLGVDVQQLKDALKATSLEQLDKRVADGTITQEVADDIRARIEAGDILPGVGGSHPGGMHHGKFGHLGANADDLAAFLGVDAATVRDELAGGKTLATVAEEAGKSREELKTFLVDQATTALSDRVAAGDITQEQADARLAALNEHIDELIDGTRPSPGMHRRAGDNDGGATAPRRGSFRPGA